MLRIASFLAFNLGERVTEDERGIGKDEEKGEQPGLVYIGERGEGVGKIPGVTG